MPHSDFLQQAPACLAIQNKSRPSCTINDNGTVDIDRDMIVKDRKRNAVPEPVTKRLGQLNAEGSQNSSSLHSFFNKDPITLGDNPSKVEFSQLHKDQIATAIGLIINSASNLQSVEIRGRDLFPFCKRVLSDDEPLEGLTSLKEIKLVRGLEKGKIVSARNSIWLLALPNIYKATLCVSVGNKDIKYLPRSCECISAKESQSQRFEPRS